MVMNTNGRLETNHNEDFDLVQYTGLKDKNGKEIWEGDIITDGRQVEFIDGSFYPVSRETGCGCCSDSTNPQLNEVIGNIYENPNLIEK